MKEQSTKWCNCGCGELAPIAQANRPEWGHVLGEPMRFIKNHDKRKPARIFETDYKIEDRGYETPCWIWVHFISRWGYGRHQRGRGRFGSSAHRLAYIQFRGPIPNDLELDHLCRQRSCVRPDHLEPVSHRENCRRGALTKADDIIRGNIRSLRETGLTQKEIAVSVGLSRPTIARILKEEATLIQGTASRNM